MSKTPEDRNWGLPLGAVVLDYICIECNKRIVRFGRDALGELFEVGIEMAGQLTGLSWRGVEPDDEAILPCEYCITQSRNRPTAYVPRSAILAQLSSITPDERGNGKKQIRI